MTHPPAPMAQPAPRGLRLHLALDEEGLVLPDGPVTILRPRAGEDFGPLDRARLHLAQGFRPDHDALRAAGYSVSADPVAAPVALVCLPRSKDEALDLIAQAEALGARLILVDGQKTDGVDSVLRQVRARVDLGGVVSKAHGKLFWCTCSGQDFTDWRAMAAQVETPLGPMQTRVGVFSADGVDPGSALLAQCLPDDLPPVMADLGAGWGYLGAQVLARPGVQALHLVEGEHSALACAQANITDPRARFHWADATTWLCDRKMDGIVMNPPFHTGRSAQPALGLAFIAAAHRLLAPRGRLWVVGNRHLPYDGPLRASFGQVTVIAETPAFRVWQASQPLAKATKGQQRMVNRSGRQGSRA